MKKIFDQIKELFSVLFEVPNTDEDRKLKRYEWTIFFCVIFMVGYLAYFAIHLNTIIQSRHPVIENIAVPITTDPNYNSAIYATTNQVAPTIVSTNTLPANEFFVGEIVGIKYFGVFGVIRNKTLGINGYVYQIRWENQERDLDMDDFYNWEIYRPAPGTVPISEIE